MIPFLSLEGGGCQFSSREFDVLLITVRYWGELDGAA